MLKKTLSLSLFALCGTLYGSAQEEPRFTADKIVAVVGNSAIRYSDVYEYSKYITAQYEENNITSDRDPIAEALEGIMLQKLLYHRALADSLPVNTAGIGDMVDNNVNAMVSQAGSIAALEKEYRKPIFDIREDITKRFTEMTYAQQMQADIQGKVKITPGEVSKFYRDFDKDSLNYVPEQYEYAQIVKYPASTNSAKQRARENLLELRERIMKGEKFEVLARIYSQDPGSTSRGGEMDPLTREMVVKPFADAMVKLKPGQVSGIVESEYGFHIIQLIDKNGNLYHVRHILVRPEFSPHELSATATSLDSVVTMIRRDSISFEDAALEYSDDKNSRLNGGRVSNLDLLEVTRQTDASLMSTKIFKDNLPPFDYDILRKLSVGEISDAASAQDMRGNVIVKSLKLVNIIPSHLPTLETDYDVIEGAALSIKQQREFDKWLDRQIESTYVRIAPEYRKPENFMKKTWLK